MLYFNKVECLEKIKQLRKDLWITKILKKKEESQFQQKTALYYGEKKIL